MPALVISADLNEATAGAALQEPFDSFSVTFNLQPSDQRRLVNNRLHFYQFSGPVMVQVNMIIRYNMQRFICAQRAPFLNGNVTCPAVRSFTVLNLQLN